MMYFLAVVTGILIVAISTVSTYRSSVGGEMRDGSAGSMLYEAMGMLLLVLLLWFGFAVWNRAFGYADGLYLFTFAPGSPFYVPE